MQQHSILVILECAFDDLDGHSLASGQATCVGYYSFCLSHFYLLLLQQP